jgi:hypothetical protein
MRSSKSLSTLPMLTRCDKYMFGSGMIVLRQTKSFFCFFLQDGQSAGTALRLHALQSPCSGQIQVCRTDSGLVVHVLAPRLAGCVSDMSGVTLPLATR